MIHNIPMPELSPDFTLEDIRKMRTWNYERLKDATVEERITEINRNAEEGFRKIEAMRVAQHRQEMALHD